MISSEETEDNNDDLDKKILRNAKTKKIARQIFFSRSVIVFVTIGVQLGLLLFFLIHLSNKIDVYLSSSAILSFGFLIYISNSHGKNEYKIAWIVPVATFPLVGITCYLLYHSDTGARKLKKDIRKINRDMECLLPLKADAESVLKKYPEIENLGKYLFNSGHFSPYENTSVKFYPSGEDVYPDFLKILKSAEKFIFIEFFIMRVDESWDGILQILKQKVKEGVEVRVICDGFGTYMVSAARYQRYLKSLGIKAKVFNPIHPIVSTPINNRDHRKIVIVDEKYALTGGINISNDYFNIGKNKFPYWKDTSIIMHGKAIFDFMRMFLEVWNIGEKKKDNYADFLNLDYKAARTDGLVIPYGDHAFNDEDIAENVYLDIISNAKKYLYITTPYVVIDNQFLSTLTFAAKRGVDVRVAVPSKPDHLATFCVGKTFLKNLIDNGVKVFIYKKGFLHAKTVLADGKIATVGSVNLDYRSFYAHFECGAIMYGSSILSDIKKDFDSMFENDCEEMHLADYKALPWYVRSTGRVIRIFGPLM